MRETYFMYFSFLFTLAHAGTHEKRLLHHLLDNYNVLERPVANESDPLQLSFGLTLMQIIDVVSIITRVGNMTKAIFHLFLSNFEYSFPELSDYY